MVDADVDAISGWNGTALHDAAANGQEKAVRLLENGADVNLDGYYSTPLIWAASCGNEVARVWLMDYGANIEAMDRDGTALHIATLLIIL
jgi:ankyrin repeat protein